MRYKVFQSRDPGVESQVESPLYHSHTAVQKRYTPISDCNARSLITGGADEVKSADLSMREVV